MEVLKQESRPGGAGNVVLNLTTLGATVFAVGFNENYMIIKQHPRTWPYPHENVTYFYILPLKEGMDWCTMNGLLGPMTIEQFNQKRKDLNIPNSLTFTKVMKDLE